MDNFSGEEAFGKTTWSLSFWIKYKNNGNRGVIFGSYSTSAGNINIEINGNSKTDNSLRLYWYANTPNLNYQSSLTLDANSWVHVAITYDGTDLKFYKNGNLEDTKTATLNYGEIADNWYFGTDNRLLNNLIGELHDFRIYNHTLSIKEIKELSKGLILHHALKGNGAGKNILPLNPFTYSSIEYESDMGQTVYIRDTTATTESYLAWGRTQQVEKSTQYTFSCMIWVNEYVKSVDYYWLSDTEENPKTGSGWVNVTSKYNNILTPNQWNYVTWTFTTKADDFTGYIRLDNNGSTVEGEHAILKACCPKVEKGSKATPYIPYGLSNTDIEEDLSGNGFNGTRQGVTFSNDSPRYYMSTEFSDTKDLVLSRLFHNGDEISNLSVSIWFNVSVTGDKNIWNFNQNNCWRHRFAGSTLFQTFPVMNNTLQDIRITVDPAIQYNTWYHNVMTFDKGIFKCYLNGELIATVDKTDVATTIKCNSNSGHWSLGDYTTGSEAVTGKLSDFRVYAKTLSADDVKELYKNSASIDKSGKVYCGELVEE